MKAAILIALLWVLMAAVSVNNVKPTRLQNCEMTSWRGDCVRMFYGALPETSGRGYGR